MTENTSERASRRDFIKTSTVAAVGTGLLGSLALSPRAYAAGEDVVKIGLVGCGGRGSGAVGDALSANENAKLVAMGDVFPEMLKSHHSQLKHKFQDRIAVDPEHMFIGFDAYQKVLASDIDLVILATPPGFRPIHFEAAVNAGKNIFMEKPVAVDGPGLRKVIAANETAKSKNLKVGVGLQRHHSADYIETVDRIKSGAIGDVLSMRVYWNDFGVWEPRLARDKAKSEMEYQVMNWYYYTWLSGDHIVEQHIHNLDVGNWIKGTPPVRCSGMGGRQVLTDKRYGTIFDHHYVEYEYPDGTRMFSQCRHQPNTLKSVSEFATGSKGSADLSDARIKAASGEWHYKHRGRPISPYQVEHADLFAAIRENRPYNEVLNGVNSTLTAIMGRMATYSGKPIEWDQAFNSELNLGPKQYAWDAEAPVLPAEDGTYPVAIPGLTKAV